MKITEVKKYIGKKARYADRYSDGEYILTACILRLDEYGSFVYTAELQDIKAVHSVMIVPLDSVTGGTDNG